MPRLTGSTPLVDPVLRDEVPVPSPQRCWLDEEVTEPSTGEQSRKPCQHRPVCRLQHRPMNLAAEHRDFVSEYDDLDGEVNVAGRQMRRIS